MATTKDYSSPAITVHFNPRRCIHAARCVKSLPDVFDPKARPWINPEAEGADKIAQTVETCPSGALTYTRHDEAANEKAPAENDVKLLTDGPLALTGKLTIESGSQETRATLCRCGLSKNKPYCDNSHVDGSFKASGQSDPDCPKETNETGGSLDIARTKDGPLKVSGNLTLRWEDGTAIATLPRAFLCRCGASKNKPFCDGSHTEAGFKDDPNA